ncbi:MAG: efflux RND transporter periplasmic adaptor subunit [Fimbriiglobus sp.]
MNEQAVQEPKALLLEIHQSRQHPVLALIRYLLGSIPTLVVLALAGATGWWGHHNDWKLPKFSELTGATKEKEDWCADHNIPESICVECDSSLLPRVKARGWCKLHGVAECVLCHPELAQLPETPVISVDDLARAKRGLDFTERPANTSNCVKHHRRIQYATAKDADKAGVVVEPVWTSPAVEFIAAPGEIVYDQTRVAHLSSRSPGSVWKVFKYLGQNVKAGDLLALVDAAEVGKAKAELLQAFATLQLKTRSLASVKESGGAVPAALAREADAAVREAEIRLGAVCQALTNLGLPIEESQVRAMSSDQLKAKLHLLGLPATVAATIDPKAVTSNLLPLVSPMDGRVMSRDVVAGEVVDATRILFEVVDTRSLWLTLDIKGEDAHRVSLGQTVRFRPDNGRQELVGKVAWCNSQADPKTRTVKVRADLADDEQKQVANTYGSGRVILREEDKVISVPNEAVQWDGCCHVVFIRDKNYQKPDAPKVFHVRKVRIGAKDSKSTEVIGVLIGELVVTKGSGLMLNELLRSELGEGCACCHPK